MRTSVVYRKMVFSRRNLTSSQTIYVLLRAMQSVSKRLRIPDAQMATRVCSKINKGVGN